MELIRWGTYTFMDHRDKEGKEKKKTRMLRKRCIDTQRGDDSIPSGARGKGEGYSLGTATSSYVERKRRPEKSQAP